MKNIYPGYIEIAKGHYRESQGVPFEYFATGQRFFHRPGVTISQQDNKIDSLDTMNICGAHYDKHYVSFTDWPDHCLGVTTLTLQTVMGMCWKTFAKKKSILSFEQVLMTNPVFAGDTLYAESEILAVEENVDDKEIGVVTVLTKGVNNKGKTVTTICYKIAIYKEGYHPLDAKLVKVGDNEGMALFRQRGDDGFIESTGLFLEEIEVNAIYEHRPGKTITSEDTRLHSLHNLDRTPQYVDKFFIDQYLNGCPQVNESYILSVVIGLSTPSFGRGAANLEMKNVKFRHPVYVNDTVYAKSIVLATRLSKSRPSQGVLSLRTQAYNNNNVLICEYERHLLYYRKNQGPYEQAGY